MPARHPTPTRAKVASPAPGRVDGAGERPSDAPVVPLRKSGIPTLVKVVGAAVVILAAVYLLSRQRDRALTEPAAPPEPAGSPAPTSAPSAP